MVTKTCAPRPSKPDPGGTARALCCSSAATRQRHSRHEALRWWTGPSGGAIARRGHQAPPLCPHRMVSVPPGRREEGAASWLSAGPGAHELPGAKRSPGTPAAAILNMSSPRPKCSRSHSRVPLAAKCVRAPLRPDLGRRPRQLQCGLGGANLPTQIGAWFLPQPTELAPLLKSDAAENGLSIEVQPILAVTLVHPWVPDRPLCVEPPLTSR